MKPRRRIAQAMIRLQWLSVSVASRLRSNAYELPPLLDSVYRAVFGYRNSVRLFPAVAHRLCWLLLLASRALPCCFSPACPLCRPPSTALGRCPPWHGLALSLSFLPRASFLSGIRMRPLTFCLALGLPHLPPHFRARTPSITGFFRPGYFPDMHSALGPVFSSPLVGDPTLTSAA